MARHQLRQDDFFGNIEDVCMVSSKFTVALIQNYKAMQKILYSNPGSTLLDVMDAFMKLSEPRATMRKMMLPNNIIQAYGCKLVHLMLTEEKYFKPFRKVYYYLYQCFDPDTEHCISTVMQYYCVPMKIQQQIYSNRLSNQSLLNFLLIELRKDKDYLKFYKAIENLIKDPILKEQSKRILNKGFCIVSDMYIATSSSVKNVHNDQFNHLYCQHEKALSAAEPIHICAHEQALQQYYTRHKRIRELKSQSEDNLHNGEKEQLQVEIASSEHSPRAIVHQPSVEFKTSANNVNAMFSDNEKCTNNNQELQAGTGNLNQQMAIPVVTTTENLYSSTEGMNVQTMTSYPESIENEYLRCNKDLQELCQYYHDIIRHLPTNFMVSVGKLEDLLTDKQIESILNCEKSLTANQKLVDYLVEKVQSKLSILDFCGYLERIKNALELQNILKALRKAVIANLQLQNEAELSVQNATNAVTEKPSKEEPLQKLLEIDLDSGLFNCLSSCFRPEVVAVLKHYYTALWRSFPSDHKTSLTRLCKWIPLKVETTNPISACTNSEIGNKKILRIIFLLARSDAELVENCALLEAIIANPSMETVVERLRNDIIMAVSESATSKQPSPIKPHVNETSSEGHVTIKRESPVLQAFDYHYNHMMLVNPQLVTRKFVSQGFFPNGDPHADNATFLPNDVKMERMLKMIRDCIALNEEHMFTQLIEVFHSEAMYAALGDKLMESYQAFSGGALLKPNAKAIKQATKGHMMSDEELEQKLKWHKMQLKNGLHYQPPPSLPPNYIHRSELLEAIVKALMNSKVDAEVSTAVTLLGMGGFGKTTIAMGLCHHPTIQRYFLDGILWIKLGPKPPTSEMMLIKLYDQLTNDKLQSNLAIADKLFWYVTNFLKRLLVIIDDVWDPQDALIYVNTFSNCKIVLTTRKNNITIHIPTKKIIEIKEMSMDESLKLLVCRVTDIQRLTTPEREMIETIAQDIHRWPILLGLVRNQLHSQIKLQSSFNQALYKVQRNLYSKGLTAFDSNVSKGNAVKACVDATLELLTKKELSNLKILVLYAGMGIKIPTSSLNYFWNDDADSNVDKLWSCGLIIMGRMALAPSVCTLSCVEMHAVITQYLVDAMDFGTFKHMLYRTVIANINLQDWMYCSPEIMEDMLASGLSNMIDGNELQSTEPQMRLEIQINIGLTDNFLLPLSIQRVVLASKLLQQYVVEKLELFSKHFKHYPQILSLLTKFRKKNVINSETSYKLFIKVYKEIKSFLSFDNYIGIINSLSNYLEDHPIQKLVENFSELLKDLTLDCKGEDGLIDFIKENSETEIIDNWSPASLAPYFGFQIKSRFLLSQLNQPSITVKNCTEIVQDFTCSYLEWIATDVASSKHQLNILSQLESTNSEDVDINTTFNAMTRYYSNMFNRIPDLKAELAEHFDINKNLPTPDFVRSLLKGLRHGLTQPNNMLFS